MPRPDLMRITVKARGDHSDSLASLRPGTRVIAEGPYGAFTPSLSGRRILLIAGGVGITPIRAMFAALSTRMPDGITLVYRASHPRDVVFSRELDAIAADQGASVHYVIGSRARLGYDPLARRATAAPDPRTAPIRGLRLRAGRHDGDGHRVAARRGGTPPTHPPRVLRLLTTASPSIC